MYSEDSFYEKNTAERQATTRLHTGEEIFNMVTHIVGGGLAVVILVACVTVAALHGSISGVITSIVYGLSMIMLYTMSSVYHGVPRGYAKKVLQVIDHCTVYFLIVGTYTPIAVCGLTKVNKAVGWTVFGIVWALAAVAITLTAIDLKKFRVFSMICYMGMGWCISSPSCRHIMRWGSADSSCSSQAVCSTHSARYSTGSG